LHDTRKRRVGSGTHVHGLGREPHCVDADHLNQSRSQAAHSAAAAAGQTTLTVVPER
jgi:hypothetical protein